VTSLLDTEDRAISVCDQTYANCGYQKKSRLLRFPLKPLLNGGKAARQSSVVSSQLVLRALPHGKKPAPSQFMGNYILPALKFLLSFDWDTEFFTYHTAIQPQRPLPFTHFILYSLYIITLIIFLLFIMLQSKTTI